MLATIGRRLNKRSNQRRDEVIGMLNYLGDYINYRLPAGQNDYRVSFGERLYLCIRWRLYMHIYAMLRQYFYGAYLLSIC